MKTEKDKNSLLEQLKKTPIIQTACEKAGVARATYYRWRNEDKGFAAEADKALFDGSLLINDLAEHQLISAIHDKNIHAIRIWLQNHHPTYTNKLEINAQVKIDEELTEEQEELIKKALELASLTPRNITSINTKNHDQKENNKWNAQ